ncbi:MAG: GDSL-type esterase/lipase family protein [Candidatus Omnitrophica bacterium]|nr:GDSL-type esterase/lipase family protein [Candidatus Omnitrophota bacterium]
MAAKSKNSIFAIATFLASVVLSMALFLTGLELYLRFRVHRDEKRTIYLSKDIFARAPSGKGYRLLPNRQYRVKGREFSYLIKSNSKGFRDRDFTFDVPPQTKRIIILGDSFTFGHGVENDQTYPKVFEKELASEGKYEVINAGIPANSLVDYIELAKELAGIYKADVIMMGLHGGDILESLEDEGLAKSAVEMGLPGLKIKAAEKIKRHFFIELKDYLRYHLLSYGFIIDKVKRNKTLSELALKLGLISSCDTPCTLNDEFSDIRLLEFLRKNLGEYSRLARKQGMVAALFFVPDKWYVASKRFYSGGKDRLAEITNILRSLCAEEDVEFVDVSSIREYPDADSALYYDYDYHFNRKGNEIFGKILYQATLRSKCLKQ